MAEERPETGSSGADAPERVTGPGPYDSLASAIAEVLSGAAQTPPAPLEGAASDPAAPSGGGIDVEPAEVTDPFSANGADRRPTRVARSAFVLLGVWLFLSAGVCYMVARRTTGKPYEVAAVAVALVGLGAVVAFAATAERRAAERRLHAELERASAILRSIEAVTDPKLAFLGLDDLLAAVLTRTKDTMGGDVVCVLLGDDEGSVLRVRAAQGATELAPVGSEVRVGEGVLGAAAQWARPVVVADADKGAAALPGSQHKIASLVAAPLIVHGSTLGLVEVGAVKERRFGPADLRLLQVVADRVAALVERARLDDVARRSQFGADHANMHLRILARGGTVLGDALETYDTALEQLADVVVPEFADWFGVHLVEDSGKIRRAVARAQPKMLGGHVFRRVGNPHPEGEELVRLAIAERRAQLLVPTARLGHEALGAAVHTPDPAVEWSDVTSMLVVPVQVRDNVLATLSFVTGPGRRGYRPSDLQTAGELAERVAVAIERVRSWRASQRAGEVAFRYAERLRRLVDASLVVNSQFGEDHILQLLVEHTQRALDADVAVVSARPSGGPLAEKAWPPECAVDHALRDDDVRGVVLAASDVVARTAEVARGPDEWSAGPSGSGASASPFSAVVAAAALRVRGWVAAPVTGATGEVRRVVVAAGPPGTQFSAEDESVLTLLAQMASVALRNAHLYAEVVGNEQRLQTLVDSSPLAIAELRATGEAQWWNRAAATLFGWDDESVPRGIPVRSGSELVLEGLLESAFGGKPVIGVAMPVAGAGNQPLELSVSVSPLGSAGAVSGVLVVAEDVTERQRMLEEFYQAERLNAMSRMAGAVAHDFNNLLTVILGCADALMRRLGDDEELGADVAAIQRAGTRAASLTSQLVRIGGQQRPVQPEAVVLDEAISSLQPMLAGILGEDVHLTITAGLGETAVLIDRSELERSVLNLAINARDAMPGGGTLAISTSRAVRGRPTGTEMVELACSDTGIGMDDETAAHCFEPFFTTKGRARGTGLGLAAVHATVTQAGGEVRVESSPGAGSRFTLTLPVAPAERRAAEEPEEPEEPEERRCDAGAVLAPPAGAGRETVLVVDDEPEVLRLEVRELEAAGFEVLGTANASEALHLLGARGGAVDLLVTDVVMPGMNGIELASAVRFSYPDVGVLFVSGHLDEDAAPKSPLPEQASLLTKPFAPDELTRRARETLARGRAGAQGSKR
ncbi:MAG: GAF domain-containing protein [Acidimicrobiales bacterium]